MFPQKDTYAGCDLLLKLILLAALLLDCAFALLSCTCSTHGYSSRSPTWKFAGDPDSGCTFTPHLAGSRLNASKARFYNDQHSTKHNTSECVWHDMVIAVQRYGMTVPSCKTVSESVS